MRLDDESIRVSHSGSADEPCAGPAESGPSSSPGANGYIQIEYDAQAVVITTVSTYGVWSISIPRNPRT